MDAGAELGFAQHLNSGAAAETESDTLHHRIARAHALHSVLDLHNRAAADAADVVDGGSNSARYVARAASAGGSLPFPRRHCATAMRGGMQLEVPMQGAPMTIEIQALLAYRGAGNEENIQDMGW